MDPGRQLIGGIITAGAAHQRRLLERRDDEALLVMERALGHILKAADAESNRP